MSPQYKCLALISLFQSLVSGVILAPCDVIFLWLEYDRIIAKSDDPNVTAIHVSLNSRLFCLARVSRIIAMTCHVHVSLVSIFFLWPESGPCLAEIFRTGSTVEGQPLQQKENKRRKRKDKKN